MGKNKKKIIKSISDAKKASILELYRVVVQVKKIIDPDPDKWYGKIEKMENICRNWYPNHGWWIQKKKKLRVYGSIRLILYGIHLISLIKLWQSLVWDTWVLSVFSLFVVFHLHFISTLYTWCYRYIIAFVFHWKNHGLEIWYYCNDFILLNICFTLITVYRNLTDISDSALNMQKLCKKIAWKWNANLRFVIINTGYSHWQL